MTSPFVQQEYQVQYMKIDGNLQTEVDTISMQMSDGGESIKTLVRGLAGRTSGASMITLNFSGSVPYRPTDTGGEGFASGGMVTGKGFQLDQVMLTNQNQNSNLPVQFILMIGNPAAQKLYFSGFIISLKTDVAVGKRITFSASCEGSFSTHVSQ